MRKANKTSTEIVCRSQNRVLRYRKINCFVFERIMFFWKSLSQWLLVQKIEIYFSSGPRISDPFEKFRLKPVMGHQIMAFTKHLRPRNVLRLKWCLTGENVCFLNYLCTAVSSKRCGISKKSSFSYNYSANNFSKFHNVQKMQQLINS